MKKLFTIYITIFCISTITAQQVSFCDDFEGYQNGDYIAQSSTNWETWTSIMGPCLATPCSDDATISNNQANIGQSLYLDGAATNVADIVLPFGSGIPYTTGNFELITDIYVTTSAYINIQAETIVGQGIGVWALDIQMDDIGNITIDNGGGAVVFLTSTFPQQQWFEFKLNIDLTQNIWEIYIDNQSIGNFSNSTNKISSINFYPTTGNNYYIDNICYNYTPYVALTYDMSAIGLDLSSNISLSSSPFTISGDILNLSSTIINSLDLNYSIDGSTPIVDNLTGLNLSLFDTLNFNHSINWTPSSTGPYLVEIWVTNINGYNDLNTSNDILGKSIYVWNDIAVRRPLIETFTSSTCDPCNPANVTAEALFAQNPGKFTSIKYQADFPGSGDPYFTQEGGNRRSYYAITSVPRMEIDGGWDQNGNDITQQVLDDNINNVCLMNLLATYSINNKTIDVDITVDPLEDYNSTNLIVHTAIIEETTYMNVKSNGETRFENVVKKMLPDDNGTALASLTGGIQSTLNQSYTFNGDYRLPSDATNPISHSIEHSVEDFSKLMVVVWVQDNNTKEVHQSTIATLAVNPSDINEETSNLSVYPNPIKNTLTINGEYDSIEIYDIYGKLVLASNAKQSINVSLLVSGAYILNINTDNKTQTQKIIITK